MKFSPHLLSIVLLVQCWTKYETKTFSLENWDPFRSGINYRPPFRFLSSASAPEFREEALDGKKELVPDGEISSTDMNQASSGLKPLAKPMSQLESSESNLINIPPHLRHLCHLNTDNFVSVAAQFNSGMWCVLMQILYVCSGAPHRSNHYPVVITMKEYDERYNNTMINSAFRLRTETHFLSFYFATTFLEQERIRALPKTMHFEALKNLIPTSSFAFADPNNSELWILVVDNATDPVNGSSNYYRHFIEEGDKLIGLVPIKEETDAALVYLRRKNYVEGYSIVGNMFYKFLFSTRREYNEKSELSRMLWGHNQEFLGCPKPVCLAPVVDTIFRLKDNRTFVFVGKYYWELSSGLSLENAVFIDAVSSATASFPYLGADIDASFYDPRELNDTIYFLKGPYIYSYTRTNQPLLERMIYGTHIEEVLKGIPRDINAAFYFRPNSTVFFFRDYHYWAYDLDNKRVLNGYPRLVTDFENMPPNIDAVFADNFGKYYVFYGVFYAMFTEEEFRIGMKLEFRLSSVDFFGCDQSLYGDYKEYKRRQESEFGPLSAKQILQLTDYEGIVITDDTVNEKSSKAKTETEEGSDDSFLTTFAKLIVYGPFFADLFVEPTNHTKVAHKEKIYYTTYIET